MNLDFHPPHLEDAGQVPTLRRLLEELPLEAGVLRVVQAWRDEPVRLIMIAPGHRNASLSLPKASLHDCSEEDWREWLRQLMANAAARSERIQA